MSRRIEADGDGLNARARLQQPLAGGVLELSASAGYFDFKFEQNTDGFGFSQVFVDNFDDRTRGLGALRATFGERWRGEPRGIQKVTQREGYQAVELVARGGRDPAVEAVGGGAEADHLLARRRLAPHDVHQLAVALHVDARRAAGVDRGRALVHT